VPEGWTQTTDDPDLIIVTSGAEITPADEAGLAFGNFGLASIRGYKFNDLNGNGADDSDPGLEDWSIELYLDDGDEGFDATQDTLVDTQTTAASTGAYLFSDLAAGSYWVREVAQEGWDQTTDDPDLIIVTSGAEITPADEAGLAFGNFQNIKLSGYKWLDANGNGSWDAGESVLNDWTIVLDTDSSYDPENPDSYIRRFTTIEHDGKLGYYEFPNITPTDIGDATTLHIYEVGGGSEWVQSYGGYTVDATSGQVVTGVYGEAVRGNFGNYREGGVGG